MAVRISGFGLRLMFGKDFNTKFKRQIQKEPILFFHCCDLERKQLTGDFLSVDTDSDSKNYFKSSLGATS